MIRQSERGHHFDASDVLFEVGRQVQALALLAKRHQLVPAQEICECGRLALRLLPVLGLHCEIVCNQWDLAYRLLRGVLERMTDPNLAGVGEFRAVGRAAIPVRDVGPAPLAAATEHSRRSVP